MKSVKPQILTEKDLFERADQLLIPQLSIDCVIFGFHNNQLKVLLLKWKDFSNWSLPGGFIFKEEHVEDAATRTLRDRTGLKNIYLQQFYTFGDPGRVRKGVSMDKKSDTKMPDWLKKRFITIGYWALVEFSKVVPVPDNFSVECKWFDVNKVPKLVLDHNLIQEKALESLRRNLNDYPIGKDLLPDKFTMPELLKLYETILDKDLDRRNFQKKMIQLGMLRRLNERKIGGAHKSPFLYQFDAKKYKKAMLEGLKFGI